MTRTGGDEVGRDFIRDIVQADLDGQKHSEIVTRFPPEPNGYLHIGHAKSIALNFGIAQEFPGRCHLRFDDTNPTKEEQEYIDSIQADVRWLGFDWGNNLFLRLGLFRPPVRMGGGADPRRARLCRRPVPGGNPSRARHADRARQEHAVPRPHRGGKPRSVPPHEGGRIPERRARAARQDRHGLRATSTCATPCCIASCTPHHPRTGDQWSIYPSYDYAHGQSDAIEGITHSICTLEFEDHRPLYDWLLEQAAGAVEAAPVRIRAAQSDLHAAVEARADRSSCASGHVAGWDDPRMPTIAGLKPRGVPPAAIREFVKRIGVAKANSVVDVGMLEFCIREDLNRTSLRRMAVLRPLKVVIENYPEGQTEELEADQPSGRSRGRHAQDHVRPRALYRAGRLHGEPAEEVLPAVAGQRSAAALRLFRQMHRRDQERRRRSGRSCAAPTIPRPRAATRPTAARSRPPCTGCRRRSRVPAEIRIYNQLFAKPNPDASQFRRRSQSAVAGDAPMPGSSPRSRRQFDRRDAVRAAGLFRARQGFDAGKPVFNRTIGLRDTFAKEVGGKS